MDSGFIHHTTPPGDQVPRLTLDNRPEPPTFTANDRYVTPGDCTALGHVYTFSSVQQNWRCVSCQHVAPAGRPAPTFPSQPAYPMPEFEPLRTSPDTSPPPGYGRLPFTLTQEFTQPKSPCAFDNLPPEMRGKPLMMTCTCPRCSPQC